MLDSRRYFKIRVKYHVIMVYYFCMRSLLTYCYSTKEILDRDFDNFVGTQKWLGPVCGRLRQRIYASHLWCKRGWEQLAHHSFKRLLVDWLRESLVLLEEASYKNKCIFVFSQGPCVVNGRQVPCFLWKSSSGQVTVLKKSLEQLNSQKENVICILCSPVLKKTNTDSLHFSICA